MQIFRLRDVIEKTGLGHSSIYKFSGLGKFPTAITLGGMSVGWTATTIEQWLARRIRERDSVTMNFKHITPWGVAITGDNTSDQDLRVLRIKQVMKSTGLARATVYKYMDERAFPRPIPLAGASVGWLKAEVTYWLASCIGGDVERPLNEPKVSVKSA